VKRKKTKFQSLSTPGVRQDLSNYLVELIFLRQNHGNRMMPKFWRDPRYKFRYMREIKACRKFIKIHGEPAVLYISRKNFFTTWTDYAKIEALLQSVKERINKQAAPKDTSIVQKETIERGKDLRLNRKKKIDKGLFQRLKEIENGEH